jgi:hypothetical protein
MTKSVSTKLPPQETRDGYILGHLSKGMGCRFGYDCEFPNPYPLGPAGDAFVAARHDSVLNDWDETLGGQKPSWWRPDWWESFWQV